MKNTPLKLLIASAILGLISAPVLANCPDHSKVTYHCIKVNGVKHCNWSAAWYEGFPETNDAAKPNDKAASFERVYWGAQGNAPAEPGSLGSTVCFYNSPYGNEIKLVQNKFGGVAYPTIGLWTKGEWDGYIGRECRRSESACQFNYP